VDASRSYRLLRIVNLLQSGKSYTARELAEELQVSRRTVFRDLNALELAHIPYYFDSDTKGYRIARHFFLPPVNLTLAEAITILSLTSRLEHEASVPLLSESARAAAKIESVLPKSIRSHLGSMLERLSLRLGPLTDHEDGTHDTFHQLSQAILRKQVCRLEYDSLQDGKRLRLRIHPLRLAFLGRAWYLLAWSCEHEQVRTFKLVRIHSLAETNQEFQTPADLDLDEHFGLAWNMIPEGTIHEIHLRFQPMVASNVAEVQWHPTQELHWNEDGSLDYHARVDGLGEISWWILGYGDQVRVVQPPALAERIAATARKTAAQYESEGT
jgi:proteasome accessory factor B